MLCEKMSATESGACIPTLVRAVHRLPLPHPLCLHLDPLKLKMATWSAVCSHTEPPEPVTSYTTCHRVTAAAPLQATMCIILTKIFLACETDLLKYLEGKAHFARFAYDLQLCYY